MVNLVLRLGNEGYLPLKWSNKSVLELNEHVEQYEDKDTLMVRLDDMMDSLLLRPSRQIVVPFERGGERKEGLLYCGVIL